jgi:hypothetical protein
MFIALSWLIVIHTLWLSGDVPLFYSWMYTAFLFHVSLYLLNVIAMCTILKGQLTAVTVARYVLFNNRNLRRKVLRLCLKEMEEMPQTNNGEIPRHVNNVYIRILSEITILIYIFC